jgi:hypothetical protein
MTKDTIVGFIKIGEKKFIEDLYINGTIFMNPISRFKEIEDNNLRGDTLEGSHYIEQGDFLKLKIKDKWIEFNRGVQDFNCQLYLDYDNVNGNIYSLYTLRMPVVSDKIIIDKKNLEFGDTFLLISYVDKFMSRVREQLDKENLKYKYGFVKYYYNKTFTGTAGVFHKSDKYAYQEEFRFFIETSGQGPLAFKIGSIKDISKVFNIEDLLDISIIKK